MPVEGRVFMPLIYGKEIWLIGVYVFNFFADFVSLCNHNALSKDE
jgi:hypothetical protein